jgi:hypothetical protein
MKKLTTSSLHVCRKSFRGKSESGIALILTLAILVMVTLLVVAFAISMRVENTASKNFNDLIKARQLAQAAVDQAVATIRGATPSISPTANYVTAPGAIYTWSGGAWVPTALFTTGTINVNFNTNVDLNANNLITGVGAGYPANGSPLLVGWTNIMNGAEMVGRFAYWVDDESAKVNVNVAQARANDLEGWTPAAIDLSYLENFLAYQGPVTNYVNQVRPLDTIESLKMSSPPLPALPVPAPGVPNSVFSNNQFYVSVNATSPDLTPWGAKRINFVEIATNASLTSDQKVAAITNAFDDADLATRFGPGKNFGAKYPNLAQIAANIIDYIDTDGQPTESPAANPPTYLGLEETPYLNELVISNSIAASPFASGSSILTFNTTALVELWNMYAINWNAVAHLKPNIQLQYPGISITVSTPPPATATPPIISFSSPTNIPASSPLHFIASGGYDAKLSQGLAPSSAQVAISTNIATITLNLGVVTAVYSNSAGRFDYAIIPLTNYSVTIDTTTGVVFNLNWVTACNDPRVKPVSNDWIPQGGGLTPGIDTLGGPNIGVINPQVINTNAAGTVFVPADGDFSCHTNAISRDRGTMYPGELSYIHTGVPWRTFWLQPQPAIEAGTVPDWAALDLFSATDTTNVVGRININSAITNSDVKMFVLPGRTNALNALLTNSLAGTVYNQGSAVANIYSYGYAPASRDAQLPVTFPNFSPYAYTMVGEVVNTVGVSDSLPADAFHTKSTRETPARGIANLITTRSDTFTIWCIAQTIKDVNKNGQYDPPPAGNDFITGEVKVQAIVQRYEDPPGTVKFRTLYYRYIYQ